MKPKQVSEPTSPAEGRYKKQEGLWPINEKGEYKKVRENEIGRKEFADKGQN